VPEGKVQPRRGVRRPDRLPVTAGIDAEDASHAGAVELPVQLDVLVVEPPIGLPDVEGEERRVAGEGLPEGRDEAMGARMGVRLRRAEVERGRPGRRCEST
jgi:hypothetical protein